MVGLGDRGLDAAPFQHLDLGGPGGGLTPIGDGHLDLAGAGVPRVVLEGQLTVRTGPDRVRVIGCGTGELQVIAIRIQPVGQHLGGHGLTGRHAQHRHPFLRRGTVLRIRHHAQVDLGGVRPLPAVVGDVGDRLRAAGGLQDHDLHPHAIQDALHRSDAGLVTVQPGRQDVAVRVRVVEQHRQLRGPAGPDAEGVVRGHGRPVLVLPVRKDGLLCDLVRFLVLFGALTLRWFQVVPVGDHLHLLQDHPGGSGTRVIEHHPVPVHPEHQLGSRLELGDGDDLVLRLTVTIT